MHTNAWLAQEGLQPIRWWCTGGAKAAHDLHRGSPAMTLTGGAVEGLSRSVLLYHWYNIKRPQIVVLSDYVFSYQLHFLWPYQESPGMTLQIYNSSWCIWRAFFHCVFISDCYSLIMYFHTSCISCDLHCETFTCWDGIPSHDLNRWTPPPAAAALSALSPRYSSSY